MDDNRCAVEGCEENGRPQVCPYDGRYHRHGCIHYENDHPFHPAMRFRSLAVDGWRWICTGHYQEIKNGERTELARREAAGLSVWTPA